MADKPTPQEIAASLNDNQKFALRDALETGERRRQEKGSTRLRRKDCNLGSRYRSSHSAPTRRALMTRDLLEPGYSSPLTPLGVKVAHIVFAEWLGEYEARADVEDIPGVVFKPTNVQEYVTGLRSEEDRADREHAEKVKRAARLWRGFKLNDSLHWNTDSRAVSTNIKAEFEDRHDWRSTLDLDLDDLILLGEQIERLR